MEGGWEEMFELSYKGYFYPLHEDCTQLEFLRDIAYAQACEVCIIILEFLLWEMRASFQCLSCHLLPEFFLKQERSNAVQLHSSKDCLLPIQPSIGLTPCSPEPLPSA